MGDLDDDDQAADGFDLRMQLIRLLGPQTEGNRPPKAVIEFMLAHHGAGEDLFGCLIDELPDASIVGKKQIIQVMDVISCCKDPQKAALYGSLVRSHLARLIDLAFVKEKGPPGLFIAEVLLKWVQKEDENDDFKKQRKDLQQFIEEASGYEENRQRRKRIMEQMEADREKHKVLREEGWSRPADEGGWEEFEKYLKGAAEPGESGREGIWRKNLERFCAANGRPLQPAKEQQPAKKKHRTVDQKPVQAPPPRPKQVFIVDIEDSFVYLDSFLLDEREAEAKAVSRELVRVAKALDDLIVEAACRLFFYADLKGLEVPNLEYWRAFDDMLDLKSYRFADDKIGRMRKGAREPAQSLGRELAYRSRCMLQRYATPGHLQGAFSSGTLGEMQALRQRLDGLAKQLNSLAHSIFAILAGRPQTRVYLMAPRSLPRLLALCSAFDLDRLVPATHLYSLLHKDRLWCLGDIMAREGEEGGNRNSVEYIVCGAREEVAQAAKELGCRFVRVRGRKDMMAFAKEFSLI